MRYYKLFFFILIPVLLILPLFHMNTAEITEQENRTLAKFPETKKKSKPNYEFGKEFESWLSDRFWGRDQLIDACFQTMYKINGRIENKKAFVGDDGWMFEKDGIVNVPSLKKQREQIEKDADILKRFDDKFKGKNIPIYLVLIPDRNQLYQKYWERYYTPKPKLDYNEELIKSLRDHPNIHIIYPKEELLETMKTEDLFYKDDIHMVNIPRKILAKNVFDRLKQDYFPKSNLKCTLTIGKKNFTHTAYFSKILGMEETIDTILTSMNLKLSQELQHEVINTKRLWLGREKIAPWIVSKTTSAPIQKIGIFFGPCYMNNIYDDLKGLFKKSIRIRSNISEAGEEAVEFIQKKTNELLNLNKDSVIILIPTDLNLIEKALQQK